MLASTTVAATILLLASKHAEASNFRPLKATHWQPLCKLAAELRKSTHQATSALQSATHKWKHLEAAKTKALLHAAVHFDNESSTAARILADCAAREQKEIISSLDSNWKKAANAIAHTNDLAGAITSTMLSISTAGGTAGDSYCLENAKGNGDGARELKDNGCTTLEEDAAAQQQSDRDEIIGNDGFKTITGGAAGNAKGTTQDKCGLFETTTDPKSDPGLLLGATNTEGLAYGIINLKTPQQPTIEDLADLGQPSDNRGKQTAKRVHNAYKQLQNMAKIKTVETDTALYAEIAASRHFDNCLATAAALDQPEKTTNQLQADVQQLKKAYFGANNNLIPGLADAIGRTNVRGTTGEAATTKKLSELDDLDLLRKALAYETSQLTATLIAKTKEVESYRKSEQTKQKTPEQICNEIKDATECGKNENCTYDENKPKGKKCTLSAEGKQAAENTAAGNQAGKDGKNTTGSNSFVINKAPLWLAVLLF